MARISLVTSYVRLICPNEMDNPPQIFVGKCIMKRIVILRKSECFNFPTFLNPFETWCQNVKSLVHKTHIQSNRCSRPKSQTVKNPTHLKPVSQLSRSFRWVHPVWACKFWTRAAPMPTCFSSQQHQKKCSKHVSGSHSRPNVYFFKQKTPFCFSTCLHARELDDDLLFLTLGFQPPARECKYTNVSSKSSV